MSPVNETPPTVQQGPAPKRRQYPADRDGAAKAIQNYRCIIERSSIAHSSDDPEYRYPTGDEAERIANGLVAAGILPSDAVRLVPQDVPICDACGRPEHPEHDAMRHPFRARDGNTEEDYDELESEVQRQAAELSGLRAELEDTQRRALVALKARGDALDDLDETREQRRALWELLKDSAWERIELRGEYDKAVSAREKLANALQVIDVAMGNEVPPFSHWSVIADRIRAMRADLAKWMDQNTRLANERDQARRDLEEAKAGNERLEKLYDASLKVMSAHVDAVRAAEVHCHLEHKPAQAGTGDTMRLSSLPDYAAELERLLREATWRLAQLQVGLRRAGTGDTAQPGDDVIEQAGLLAARPDEPPVCAAQAKYGLATWRCDLPAGHDGHHQETRPHIVGWEDA